MRIFQMAECGGKSEKELANGDNMEYQKWQGYYLTG